MNQVETNDPLAVSSGDVDTSYPLLHAKQYTMTIAKVEKVRATPREGNDNVPIDNNVLDAEDPHVKWNLKIRLETTTDLVSTSGEPLAAGFPLTTYVALDPRGDDYPILKVRKGLAAVLQAVYGEKNDVPLTVLRDDPESIQDKVVEVKVKIGKPTAEYPNPSNSIGQWIPAKA